MAACTLTFTTPTAGYPSAALIAYDTAAALTIAGLSLSDEVSYSAILTSPDGQTPYCNAASLSTSEGTGTVSLALNTDAVNLLCMHNAPGRLMPGVVTVYIDGGAAVAALAVSIQCAVAPESADTVTVGVDAATMAQVTSAVAVHNAAAAAHTTTLVLRSGANDYTKAVLAGASELTIATGAVTATQTVHTIDTEADAASDDLATISGGADGQLLILMAAHTDRTVVLKHGTGNLSLGGADITIDATDQAIMLYYDGTLTAWLYIGNTAGTGDLVSTNNLSDVADAATARGNLGAGTGDGTVTAVTGTSPVASSGGATPAISMAAASAGVAGHMTGAYATKLDGIAAGADVTGSNAPQAHKDSHDPNDGSDPLDTAAPAEIAGVQAAAVGTAHTLARADHAHQIQHGITDNHIVTIDDADAADDDFARFTANGLEGRSAAETLADIVAQGGTSGATLPTGGSIVTGQVFRLTGQDSTAKAGQGIYLSPDGTNWVCLQCWTPYAWGNTGATPTFALIAGCGYIFTQDQEITSDTVTMAYPGECPFTKTGAFAFAAPTMAGKTVKTRGSAGWDDAPDAIVEGHFRYDGTYLWISAIAGA